MVSELDDLSATAEELARLAGDRPEGEKAHRLAERLRTGRFHIAVVGEFNRGKSTLINAMVGESVVPTGVLPLTAIATELAFGDPGATVEYLDGRTEAIAREKITAFVTEASNPANKLGVARVVVRGEWSLVRSGVVLVDTPGIASLYEHSTEAGRAALFDSDGVVVVLSADTPLSAEERDLLHVLRERRSLTFFVLNKSDHLHAHELAEVRRFVAETIRDVLGVEVHLFAVDARGALGAHEIGGPGDGAGREFPEFVAELSRFVSDDLQGARANRAKTELARLGSSLSEAVTIERAARQLTADELTRLLHRFDEEATRQRKGLDDDRALLARDIGVLVEGFGRRLADFSSTAAARHLDPLTETAAHAPRSRLDDELRATTRSAVESAFEDFRPRAIAAVDAGWREVATAFRSRVQTRLDAARQAATDLFEVPLPTLAVPAIAEQRDRFSFLFIHVGSTTEALSRGVSRLLPVRWARQAALRRARDELHREFDKHAGRARWDLTQRLESARLELEKAMQSELELSIEAILQAADRARQWHDATRHEQVQGDELAARLARLGADLAALDAGGL